MSVFSECRALIFVADHAVNGADGKITALGIGFRVTGIGQNGLTPAQALVVVIDVPAKFVNQEFPISIDLRRADNNQVVQMVGANGQPDSLRIQQLVRADPSSVPGAYLPTNFGSRVQVVLGFPNGLQLQPGVTYKWSLEIEAQHRAGWEAEFHVLGPPPQPVVGGPASEPTEAMPSLTEYVVPHPQTSEPDPEA